MKTMKDYIPKFDDARSARRALRAAKKELRDAEWVLLGASNSVSNWRVRVMGLEIAVQRTLSAGDRVP